MSADPVPLCVDLDGTLLRSDSLVESALALVKQRLRNLWLMPRWLLRGRAAFKAEIGGRVQLDVARLPYHAGLLKWLREQHGVGRRLVLCTAADQSVATAVAGHLKIFERALGSDGRQNLKGTHKRDRLQAEFGARGYDYAGNSGSDLAVWSQARRAVVVNGSASLARRAGQLTEVEQVFDRGGNAPRAWLRALRPYQWLKNILVFAPMLAAHAWYAPGAAAISLLAFLAFCMCASGTYLLNDLLDLAADRAHPRKRLRPFASGELQPGAGLLASALLTVTSMCLARSISGGFLFELLTYFSLSLAYSLHLKKVPMLDVFALAALYTLRIIAGGVAVKILPSFWLLAFSMFLFLTLAMVKRCSELIRLRAEHAQHTPGRGYRVSDLLVLEQLGSASGYLSVLVLALYINTSTSQSLYRHQQALWLLCPLLLYWISRVWIVCHRGHMHDDPILFALRDHTSRWIAALALLILIVATG
jgi:4-hydroxybenzoate polyprenyltransferase